MAIETIIIAVLSIICCVLFYIIHRIGFLLWRCDKIELFYENKKGILRPHAPKGRRGVLIDENGVETWIG